MEAQTILCIYMEIVYFIIKMYFIGNTFMAIYYRTTTNILYMIYMVSEKSGPDVNVIREPWWVRKGISFKKLVWNQF